MAVKKHLIFIVSVLCWNLAVSQHGESSVTDIFHPHIFNPAFRLDADTMELKFFGNYYLNNNIVYTHKSYSNILAFEFLVQKINTVIGIEAGYDYFELENFEFPPLINNTATDVPVSLFCNTEIVKNLYAGAEIEYTDERAKRVFTETDSVISSRQSSHWGYGFGLSYTPGNFILGIYYRQEEVDSNSSGMLASAGYMNEVGKFEILFLGTYASDWNSTICLNLRLSYDEKLFLALMAKENVSRLTNASSTQYGFAVGGAVFDSRLMFGIGINKTIHTRKWIYSPFLIYSL